MAKRNDPNKQVSEWNQRVAIGELVNVRLDDGSVQQTRTTSEAWVLGGHSAVVMLEGIWDGYMLSRVTPAIVDSQAAVAPPKREQARIYLASSWRNAAQPDAVARLKEAGHLVYDFRNPAPGNHGFKWSSIDPVWKAWNPEEFRRCLEHPIAEQGYGLDWGGMQWADTCLLLLPCGRSAHLEGGYFVGARKRLIILLAEGGEPELMYKMASDICVSFDEVLAALQRPFPF